MTATNEQEGRREEIADKIMKVSDQRLPPCLVPPPCLFLAMDSSEPPSKRPRLVSPRPRSPPAPHQPPQDNVQSRSQLLLHHAAHSLSSLAARLQALAAPLPADAASRALVLATQAHALALARHPNDAIELYRSAFSCALEASSNVPIDFAATMDAAKLDCHRLLFLASTGIKRLPSEILVMILSHLSQKDRFRASHVSRAFYQAAHSSVLWQKFILDSANPAHIQLFHHALSKNHGRFTSIKLNFSEFKYNWSFLHLFSGTNLSCLSRLCLIGSLSSVYSRGRTVFEDIILSLLLKCSNLSHLELDANSELTDQFMGLYLLFTPNLSRLYLSGPQIVFDLIPEPSLSSLSTSSSTSILTGPPRILNRFKAISFYESKTHSFEQVNAVQYITSTAALQLTIDHRTPLHTLESNFNHLTGDVKALLYSFFKHAPEQALPIDLVNLESISWFRGPLCMLPSSIKINNLRNFRYNVGNTRIFHNFRLEMISSLSQRTPLLESLEAPGIYRRGQFRSNSESSIVGALKNWPNLKILDLSFTDITHVTLQGIADYNHFLRHLSLAGCQEVRGRALLTILKRQSCSSTSSSSLSSSSSSSSSLSSASSSASSSSSSPSPSSIKNFFHLDIGGCSKITTNLQQSLKNLVHTLHAPHSSDSPYAKYQNMSDPQLPRIEPEPVVPDGSWDVARYNYTGRSYSEYHSMHPILFDDFDVGMMDEEDDDEDEDDEFDDDEFDGFDGYEYASEEELRYINLS